MTSKYIPNSFQIANAIIDDFFHYLTGNEFKCYCYIARKTIGWQKQAEYISISDLMTGCNLSNKSIVHSVSKLEELGLIFVQRKQVENAHKINKITINLTPKINDEILQKISSKKQGGCVKNTQGGCVKNTQGGCVKNTQGGCVKNTQGCVKNTQPTAPNTLISQGLQDSLNTLCTDIDKSISLNTTETKVSSETLLSEKNQVQNSSTEEFCVPPTSQSEVVSPAENSQNSVLHSSPNEEKTADEKIEHIENEIIEPEKTRLPEKTIDQNQDMFGSEQNALSVVKPKKVVKAITTETLISQFHIDPQTAHDFMTVRKAKKAPLTYRALQSIQREAEKINLTLEQALQICTERNWQGFQAHWLLKERNEVLQSMTPEQKEKETQKAYAYFGKVLDALIAKGVITQDDYYKFGRIATEKFDECFSVEEAYQTMMNAINEQTQQQTAIGA